jgi:hypothetical protein
MSSVPSQAFGFVRAEVPEGEELLVGASGRTAGA